jgi:hypothetical protein
MPRQKNKNNQVLRFLLLTGLSSTVTFLAAGNSINLLKFPAVLLQITLLITALKTLRGMRSHIDWPRATLYIAILSVYPISHIIISVIVGLEMKKITDGFFIYSTYYQLPLVALAITVLIKEGGADFKIEEIIKRYGLWMIPIYGISIILGNFTFSSDELGGTYLIFNNLLIPFVTLLFFSKINGKTKIMALISLTAILILVIMFGSRSYLLVISYLIFFILIRVKLTLKKVLLVLSISLMVIVLNLSFSSSPGSFINNDDAMTKKLNLEDIEDALSRAVSQGSFQPIFEAESNSRSEIVIDAFSNQSVSEIMVGKGIFGTYESFVERNTIELGWAQEIFWFGFVYVGLVFLLSLNSWYWLKRSYRSSHADYTYFLSSILVIRFLDGWIFGMPSADLYNLFFFLAVMFPCVKKNKI